MLPPNSYMSDETQALQTSKHILEEWHETTFNYSSTDMGILMPNIHVPTTDSSQTSEKELDDLPLPELIRRKDRLESELSALGSVLDSHGVRMTSSLTTFDGYPRADIDVAQVRTTRARIIHLRNDHKALMARIERGLHAHFAAHQAVESEDSSAAATAPRDASISSVPAPSTLSAATGSSNAAPNPSQIGPPFAIVNSVSPDSPAATAGLQMGDKIQKFGEATWLNHEKLSLVARVVGRSEGMPVEVVLSRRTDVAEAEQRVNLTLVPRSGWGGRGLLGCHLLPL